jgi:hypothetical protein
MPSLTRASGPERPRTEGVTGRTSYLGHELSMLTDVKADTAAKLAEISNINSGLPESC